MLHVICNMQVNNLLDICWGGEVVIMDWSRSAERGTWNEIGVNNEHPVTISPEVDVEDVSDPGRDLMSAEEYIDDCESHRCQLMVNKSRDRYCKICGIISSKEGH